MFGLGGTEVLVLFVLALLLFGPRKLPEIGRTLGKAMSELRRATFDFRTGLEREVQLDKLRETGRSLQSDLSDPSGSDRPAEPSTRPPGGPAPETTRAEPTDGTRRDEV